MITHVRGLREVPRHVLRLNGVSCAARPKQLSEYGATLCHMLRYVCCAACAVLHVLCYMCCATCCLTLCFLCCCKGFEGTDYRMGALNGAMSVALNGALSVVGRSAYCACRAVSARAPSECRLSARGPNKC